MTRRLLNLLTALSLLLLSVGGTETGAGDA